MSTDQSKIRVLIVDDSAVIRRILSESLNSTDDIEVVGTAVDPYDAQDKIAELDPDVMTLDIEMPKMDGITFLKQLMSDRPIPTLIISSVAQENSENAMRALSLGAVGVIAKPGSSFSPPDKELLVMAVREANMAQVFKNEPAPEPTPEKVNSAPMDSSNKVVAIGASTGGTKAIEQMLSGFPVNCPGTVITQHMPEGFTAAFAQRLNEVCKVEVKEAVDGDQVIPGRVLIAPSTEHMLLNKNESGYIVSVKNGPSVNFQKPSVDVLFNSVARHAGANGLGVILTGIGKDGAKGLLAMKQKGARTFAQDENSCVIYEMPKAAIELDAADQVVSLQKMTEHVLNEV